MKALSTIFRISYLFSYQYQYIKGLCYTFESLGNEYSLLGRDVMTSPIGKLNQNKASCLSPVFLKMEDIATLTILHNLSCDKLNNEQ